MTEKLEYVRIKDDPLPRLYRVLKRVEDQVALFVVDGPDIGTVVYAFDVEVLDGRDRQTDSTV